MSAEKRVAIKTKFREKPDPVLIEIDEFFDGNEDEGSIGCNLIPEHPGIPVFQTTLSEIKKKEGVKEVAVLVSELDPCEEAWPYTDTVCVFGDVNTKELAAHVAPLHPNEVYRVGLFSASILKALAKKKSLPLTVLWWD
jgi:hypothetical protein